MAVRRIKRERVKDEAHERFIRSLCCVVCGDGSTVECAHVSYADLRYGKDGRAFGRKEESMWTLPLCGAHHKVQHSMNEKLFWSGHGIDPCRVAAMLYIFTGDAESAAVVIENARVP